MFSFLFVAANVFAKGPVENKKNVQNTVRNSSFTNIVGNNMGSEVTGWVRYNKANKCFQCGWVRTDSSIRSVLSMSVSTLFSPVSRI